MPKKYLGKYGNLDGIKVNFSAKDKSFEIVTGNFIPQMKLTLTGEDLAEHVNRADWIYFKADVKCGGGSK